MWWQLGSKNVMVLVLWLGTEKTVDAIPGRQRERLAWLLDKISGAIQAMPMPQSLLPPLVPFL